MMHMTFYWGTNVTLLFDFWKTESLIAYSLTLLVCLLFSAFYQYLESFRIQLQLTSAAAIAIAGDSNIQTPLIARYTTKLVGAGGSRSVWLWKTAGAVMFGVNSTIGYMLMLAVMSFNGGVLIAVVVGLSLGYLFFRSSPSSDQAGVVAVVDNSCACA